MHDTSYIIFQSSFYWILHRRPDLSECGTINHYHLHATIYRRATGCDGTATQDAGAAKEIDSLFPFRENLVLECFALVKLTTQLLADPSRTGEARYHELISAVARSGLLAQETLCSSAAKKHGRRSLASQGMHAWASGQKHSPQPCSTIATAAAPAQSSLFLYCKEFPQTSCTYCQSIDCSAGTSNSKGSG